LIVYFRSNIFAKIIEIGSCTTLQVKSSQVKFISTLWSKFQIANHAETTMWADAQRDGHPAEYRRHPLRKFRNSIPCTTPQTFARVPCSNAVNIGERKTWTQSEFCTWQNSVMGQQPRKCIYSVLVQDQETAKHRAKFG